MTSAARILLLGAREDDAKQFAARLGEGVEIVPPDAPAADGVITAILPGAGVPSAKVMLQSVQLLEQLPLGLAQVNAAGIVRWCNPQLERLTQRQGIAGHSIFEALGNPELLGPDFSPVNSALLNGQPARCQMMVSEKVYLELSATPLVELAGESADAVLVTIRDISAEVLQRQKLNAIHQAGLALRDLTPEILVDMSVADRVELLKQQIVHFTQSVLGFETIEIRLLDAVSRELQPLLQVGMTEAAASRALRAEPTANGVTGFVAATGTGYLCEDTTTDPLYLEGAAHAKSSLTVPLMLHDEVHGTINVESFQPGWFNQQDLQFLEMFSREVATALNTLELLVAEKFSTVTASTELLLREVAQPVDEVLNDTVMILEKYIGHDPAVCERLQKILKNARSVRSVIHKVGESIAPTASTASSAPPRAQRPKLRSKRVLVADADESVRLVAHELLGRFGCIVETAHNGEEAVSMHRSTQYDAILIDIRLPDMNGYECVCQLRDVHAGAPIILMTGYGYDPTHSIVKARQQGLKSVLYKPFRVDQLLSEVENMVAGESV